MSNSIVLEAPASCEPVSREALYARAVELKDAFLEGRTNDLTELSFLVSDFDLDETAIDARLCFRYQLRFAAARATLRQIAELDLGAADVVERLAAIVERTPGELR